MRYLFIGFYLFVASSFAQTGQLSAKSMTVEPNKTKQTKFTSSDFAGRWHGDENCSKISTPDAILTIKPNGPVEVIVMGLYASNGGIKGTIVGNTISIPQQTVPDFDFRITVEGVLVLSSDHQFLNSNVSVVNDGLKDVCANSYTH